MTPNQKKLIVSAMRLLGKSGVGGCKKRPSADCSSAGKIGSKKRWENWRAAQGSNDALVETRCKAERAVLEREQGFSTGLQNGIALPHGRTDAVNRLVCAVGLKPEGVDFDTLDGKPARIIMLVLTPQ